jgi:cytochrome c553
MRRVARWLGYGLAVICCLGAAGLGALWLASTQIYNRTHVVLAEHLPALAPGQLAEGPRLLRVLGCTDCHGGDLRGKLVFDSPWVAKVWAPNLTLVAAQANDAQLAAAIRQGIGHDGRSLWIMPSGLYSRLSANEVAALVAAIRRTPRGGEAVPPIRLGPLGRLGIVMGKFRSAPATIADFRSREPFYAGGRHEWGRQLAARICGDCHAPDLTGGQPGFGKTPPDLRLAAGYSADEFRRLMRTGRPPDGRDLGLMRFIAEQGLHALRDDEIAAVHAYLTARAAALDR